MVFTTCCNDDHNNKRAKINIEGLLGFKVQAEKLRGSNTGRKCKY